MTVVFLLLPIALLLAIVFVAMFVWATRDGQFDDVRTPQIRVLFDDEAKQPRPRTSRPASGNPEELP